MSEKMNYTTGDIFIKNEEYHVSSAAKMAAFEKLIPELTRNRRKECLARICSVVSKVLCGITSVPEVRSMPSIASRVRKAIATSETIDHNDIAKLFRISEGVKEKEEGREEINALRLPKYKKQSGTIGEFLKDPDEYFRDLNTEEFYPSIMNKLGERDFRLGATKEETKSFIKKSLKRFRKPFFIEDDKLSIYEFLKNSKGGNLIVDNEGGINIEMLRGQHTDLAYGDKSPDLIGGSIAFGKKMEFKVRNRKGIVESYTKEVKDKFKDDNGRIPYYFELPKLKSIVESLPRETTLQRMVYDFNKRILDSDLELHAQAMQAILSIPRNSGNYEDIHPGYYEFIFGLAKGSNPGKSTETLKFIDMRKPDHYADGKPGNPLAVEIRD